MKKFPQSLEFCVLTHRLRAIFIYLGLIGLKTYFEGSTVLILISQKTNFIKRYMSKAMMWLYAHLFIDDAAIGCPLKINIERPDEAICRLV